jgi:hypothetical protein
MRSEAEPIRVPVRATPAFAYAIAAEENAKMLDHSGSRCKAHPIALAGVWAALVLLFAHCLAADSRDPRHFDSPSQAMDTLLEAIRSDDMPALQAIFGPDSEELLSSGDEVADREGRQRFLAAAEERTEFEEEGGERVVVSLGADDWPFPIPLVKKKDQGWYFDSDAGKEELINRRIGRDELNAISVARAYVDAQHEYAELDPSGEDIRQYAQKFLSSEGKHDGLYWPAEEDEPESPMGPLVAEAVEAGYDKKAEGDQPTPYYGYYFRILTAQGPHAPGKAKNYVEDGRMTKGFALVAYPAEYGNSGIMSFIVNQNGIVFQKDLGEDTDAIAEMMTEYDPDDSWEPVFESET